MSAKILALDIETQRAIVEVWSLWDNFIGIDNVIQDARVLCFAAKWRGEDRMIFKSAWEDPWNSDTAEGAYLNLIQYAYDLLDEADIVVTFNGDKFDLQWLEEECGRLGLGRPAPYKSVDLRKIAKKNFGKGLLSGKLDWSARRWLRDKKTPHGGTDLWHDIRYGNKSERRKAQKVMREYNEHDVEITENLFEAYLPWSKLNLAIYGDNFDGEMKCLQCESTNLKRDGNKFHATAASFFQMWRCKDCGATSRGAKSEATTVLRPV